MAKFTGIDQKRIERLTRELLVALGEDPDRPGLVGTPDRVARAWVELLAYEDNNTDTTFEAINTDQLVVVRNISVWSMCEHHLLPFHCKFSVGYITRKKVLGLSKIPRIAVRAGHGLQLQERITQTIWTNIAQLAQTNDVAVLGVGRHTCMEARGIMAHGSSSTTSNLGGVFRERTDARQEFLNLALLGSPDPF